jgi:hypothetical protein
MYMPIKEILKNIFKKNQYCIFCGRVVDWVWICEPDQHWHIKCLNEQAKKERAAKFRLVDYQDKKDVR